MTTTTITTSVSVYVSRSKSPSGVSDPFCAQSVQLTVCRGVEEAASLQLQCCVLLDRPSTFEHLRALLSRQSCSIHVASEKQVPSSVLEALQRALQEDVDAQSQSQSQSQQGNPRDADASSSSSSGAPPNNARFSVSFHTALPAPKRKLSQLLPDLLSKEASLAVKAHPELSVLLQPEAPPSPLSHCLDLFLSAHHHHHDTTNSGRPCTLSMVPAPSFMSLDGTAAEAIHLWPPCNQVAAEHTGGHVHNNSLYGILQQPLSTTPGKRMLSYWLQQPLIDLELLTQRQEAVQCLVQQGLGREALQQQGLRGMATCDLDALAHLLQHYEQAGTNCNSSGTAMDDDADLSTAPFGSTTKALQSLYQLWLVVSQKLPLLKEQLETTLHEWSQQQQTHAQPAPVLLLQVLEGLTLALANLSRSCELAEDVLDLDAAPREFRIRPGYKPELQQIQNELEQVEDQVQECLQRMSHCWAQVSGKTDGVKLEQAKSTNTSESEYQFRLANANDIKQLQQTQNVQVLRVLKNGVYFTTKELRELGNKKQNLRAEYDSYQRDLVMQAMQVAATYAGYLQPVSHVVATLDVLVALAHVAAYNKYVRPTLTDEEHDGCGIVLQGARHPCVELQDKIDFIPNDIRLVYGESSFLLVTGPNMGGKSTYIRSVGAVVTLAQIGSFVPCTSAQVNICHDILARVGAGDLQERGISTFMAEMLESSSILRRATKRSLIIIDELGRGTSTFDGYGLAAAISEYIIDTIGCMTVFTTHFHELTALEDQQQVVKNYHVTAKKGSHGLTFLYEVKPGPCLESFGIQVAEMANVPSVVIQDAKQKAKELENFEYSKKRGLSPSDVRDGSVGNDAYSYAVDDHDQAESAAADLAFANRLRRLDVESLFAKEYPSPEAKRVALLQALELSV